MWHTAKKRIEREEQILLSLKKLDYLTRSQIQTIHKLGKNRNAIRVLRNMEKYINYFRDGENIYYLSAEGRKRVGAEKAHRRSTDAKYYILRNYVYIKYGCPQTWENNVKLNGVTAGATFRDGDKLYIVESETEKLGKYKEMVKNGKFAETPVFIWVTLTRYMKEQLEKELDGLNSVVYTLDNLKKELKTEE